MRTWLLLALPSPLLVFALEKLHGVSPQLASQYVETAGQWTCLDGSKKISWKDVNDDYCDCPDGSDEPGTGACPNSTFYCTNAGHIGASISHTRVNDGLCEPECCDGSDEPPGVCPNKCAEIGEEYRKKVEQEMKTRKTGSKIRSTYIQFAQKEKKRLEAQVTSSKEEIATREKEVAHLRDVAERAESLSAAALAHRQQSPLYISLTSHAAALKSLKREHDKLLDREKQLGDILDALRSGYNPNYQDMAVLEAVRGWEALAGLPRLGEDEELGKDEDEEADIKSEVAESESDAEVVPEGEWSKQELDEKLNGLLRADHVSLLFEHDKHVASPSAASALFDVTSYLPDSLLPQWESLRESVLEWLSFLGWVPSSSQRTAGEADTKARQALNDAEHSLELTRKELKNAEEDLKDIYDVEGFGTEGQFKKLDGTCLNLDAGEYTYEICLFDEAKQKPNRGGSTHSLGMWAGWNTAPGVEVGSQEYYLKQHYKNGAKCWNGPMRSVTLAWTCGLENAILTVAEPEKCEYLVTGTTPALCLPLDADDLKAKDEL